MDKIKPFIIFRADGFYQNLIHYLDSNNFSKTWDIVIYVDEILNLEETDYKIQQIKTDLSDTESVRKQIYEKLEGSDLAVICDTYHKYEEPIDFTKFNDTTFILLDTCIDDISLPYLMCYNNADNADFETFNMIDYFDNDDNIYSKAEVHTKFIETLVDEDSNDMNSVILRFCFSDENKFLEEGECILNDDNQALYPKLIKLFKGDELLYENELIKIAMEIITDDHEFISTYFIFDKVLKDDDIISNFLMAGLSTSKPVQNIFYYTGDIDKLITKYVRYFEKYYKSTFMVHMPTWLDKSLIPYELQDKYLPKIDISKELHDSYDSSIIDFEEYNINNVNLTKKDGFFTFNNEKYEIFSPLNYNDKLLVATSNKPFKIHCLNDNKLIQIFDTKKNIDTGLLFGNIIKFFSNYVCLAKIRDNCYVFQVFMDKTLEPKGHSQKFTIKNPIGLVAINDELFILTKHDDKIYKCKVDLVKYFTDICVIHDISNVYDINIRDKNNVLLSIKDYDNILSNSCGLRFNQDEEPCAKVEYNYDNKIINYNDKLHYVNKFIYMPSNEKHIEKTNEVFFYGDCSILSQLKDKFQELSISIGNDYMSSKYCFIMQSNLERLNNIELSKILDHNTIIVSVITKEQLESNNFIKKFTGDKILQKLFLFNIGMNDNYIEFIIEKIILDNQYDKRKQYMSIDRENIFKNSNIYKIIKSIKDGNFETKIEETNKSLFSKIKKNLFGNDSSFNNVINFIINKEFDIQIRYLNTSIPESLKKLNLFGTNKSIMEDAVNFDIVVLQTINDLKNIEVSDKEVFFYINDTNKILIT